MDIRFTVFRIFAATIFTEHEKDTSCCSAVLFYTDLSYDVLLLAASVLARDTKKVTANSGQSLWTWTYSSALFMLHGPASVLDLKMVPAVAG